MNINSKSGAGSTKRGSSRLSSPSRSMVPAQKSMFHRVWLTYVNGFDLCEALRSGYLDDLFVEPDQRGGGAVDALFGAINQVALDRGWDVVRWTTADNNYRARATYDKIALRTTWITYDMTPNPTGAAEQAE